MPCATLAELPEDAAGGHEQGHATHNQATVMSMSHAGTGENPRTATTCSNPEQHVLLYQRSGCRKGKAKGAVIPLRLATGKYAEGLVLPGEVYATGVEGA